MKKSLILSVVTILIIAVAIGVMLMMTGNSTPQDPLNGNGVFEHNDVIRIFHPSSGQTVSSPLYVEGEARGMWYFEASFPVSIIAEDGTVLLNHYIMTPFDWMTEEYVPFYTHLEFAAPTQGTGTLVLHKDNPSGLPEYDDEVRIPIQFGAGLEKTDLMDVRLHFSTGGQMDCAETFAVTRQVPRTQAVARAAIDELLKGSTQTESEIYGLFNVINPGVKLQDITVENGVARVDFSDRLDYQVGGSCRVIAIVAQITNTLLEFPTVNEVVISIDGRIEDILQP